MPDRFLIFLRIFAETDDPSVAIDLAGVIVEKAGRYGWVRTRPVERYWKIPEFYEVAIELRPDGGSSAAYEGVLADLAAGWERHGSQEDLWAIWNPTAEGYCFSPLVTWMSVNMLSDGESVRL